MYGSYASNFYRFKVELNIFTMLVLNDVFRSIFLPTENMLTLNMAKNFEIHLH